jgi:hypothetical protein
MSRRALALILLQLAMLALAVALYLVVFTRGEIVGRWWG